MAKADLGREVQRKHREAGIRMAPKDARRYARMLMKEGHALVSGEHVRGKQVKATRTNKTNFKPETVAYKIGDFGPCHKAEMVAEIVRLTGKDEDEASRCLVNDLRKRGAAIYDEDSNTWRGYRVPSTVLLLAKFNYRDDLTDLQKKRWEVFGEASGVPAEFAGGKIVGGEIVQFTIARHKERGEVITEAEAVDLIDIARHCSRITERIPIEIKDGKVYGKNWYRPGSFLDLPRNIDPIGDNQGAWMRAHTPNGSDPYRHLAQAIELGDVDRTDKAGTRILAAERKQLAEQKAIIAELEGRSAKLKARIAEYDERALSGISEDPGFERFVDTVNNPMRVNARKLSRVAVIFYPSSIPSRF